MALKDWRVGSRTNKRYKEWINILNGDVVTIEISPSGWKVYISLLSGETSHSFKSQKEALKFAKDYMRSH
jgi:hypothetical protein